MAISRNNPSFCDKINDNDFKGFCYSRLAKKANSSDICQSLNNIEVRDSCFSNVAISENDCKEIIDEHSKNICYIHLAKSTGNPDYCENVTENFYNNQQECYITLSTSLNSRYQTSIAGYDYSQLCNKIIDSYSRSKCLIEVNKMNQKKDKYLSTAIIDESDCEKIIDEYRKDICYFNLADENNNPEYCEKTIIKAYKYYCYYNLAQKNHNIEYCEKLTDERFPGRLECYRMIENQKINDGKDKELKDYNYIDYTIISFQKMKDETDSEVNDGWKRYNDFENGFSIEYPIDWLVRLGYQRSGGINSEESVIVGFSPRGHIDSNNPGASNKLTVKIYDADDYPLDWLIARIHKDAIDRTEERENIKIGNINATKVRVTYTINLRSSSSSYTSEAIFIEDNQKIYKIITSIDDRYKAFYESFRLL